MSDPRFDRDELNRPVDGDFDRPRSSNAMWGWIAGVVFLVIVMALIFGPGSGDNQSAMNDRPAANSVTTGAATGTQASRPTPAPVAPSGNASPSTPSTTGQGTNNP